MTTVSSTAAPVAQAPAPGPLAPAVADTLTCVFAIREAEGAGPAVACAGHDGGSVPYELPLSETGRGGLCGLAQDVPAADFSDQALRDRLSDSTSLEVFARTHHAMVNAAAATGPVIPLPLATLFTDRYRAAEALSGRAAQFRLLLDRLRGMQEWAVKVYASAGPRGKSESPPGRQATPGSTPPPGAGRAYLDMVRARRADQQARQAAASAVVSRIDEELRSVAGGAVLRRPHGAQVTGRHRLQVLNGAYLVDTRDAERLRHIIEALRSEVGDVEIEVSGPWVPYSFTTVD